MDKKGLMIDAAANSLKSVLNLITNDEILIVSDTESRSIAEAFKIAGKDYGCMVKEFNINGLQRPLINIPDELLNMLPNSTVVLNIIKALPEEVPFRISWIFAIEKNKKIKCAHMPGITEGMMTEGPMNVDYAGMMLTATFLINHLRNAERLRITTKEGTDLLLGVSERIFSDDVYVTPGNMCNLPCGEIYCAPEETEANGVVVVNASIGDIGLLKQPLKISIKNGKVANFDSEDKNLINKITELTEIDEDAKKIGELGIGVNPKARIKGNMLEDEKAIGTAHIALGNNEDFPGGQNKSKIHRDYLFYKPTIEAFYKDKKNKIIVKDGEFLVN